MSIYHALSHYSIKHTIRIRMPFMQFPLFNFLYLILTRLNASSLIIKLDNLGIHNYLLDAS